MLRNSDTYTAEPLYFSEWTPYVVEQLESICGDQADKALRVDRILYPPHSEEQGLRLSGLFLKNCFAILTSLRRVNVYNEQTKGNQPVKHGLCQDPEICLLVDCIAYS